MKKQTVSQFIFLLTASIFFFSCGNKMNKNTGSLEFDSIQVNKTVHLFGDTAKPACNIIVNFTYPTQSSDPALKDSLNTFFTMACFGEKYMYEQPDSTVAAYVDNYIRQYRHDLEPPYLEDEKNQEDGTAVGNWYSYYKNIEGHVQDYKKNLLVYRVDYQEYTGGAHGMYTSTYLNIDLTQHRQLHLDDIFVGDYREGLTNLIWNQLMANNKVATREELEDLGYGSTGEIAPTENFYLSDEGITFYYNVYDITPYAMGPVKVTISKSLMENIIGYKW